MKNIAILKNLSMVAIAIGFVGLGGAAQAAILVNFPFTTDTNHSQLGTNVQSAIYNGSNLYNWLIGDDGFGNVLQAYPTNSTDYTSALNNNSYFTISLTAQPSQTLDLGLLNFEVGKGGSSDPRGYIVRSSIDGYTTDLLAETLPSGSQTAPTLKTINFENNLAYQNLSSVDFRFYVYAPTPLGSYSVDFRNLTLTEATPVSVPEPASVLGIFTVAALVTTLKRRQKEEV